MKSVVINDCYGGFRLSEEAIKLYGELKGLNLKKIGDKYGEYYINGIENDKNLFDDRDIKRDDPCLVETVLILKKRVNGICSDLKLVEIPKEVSFSIEEYDGLETVVEKRLDNRRRWN